MKSSEQLRNMLKEPGLIQLPGCFDCITAMLAWKAGFPALYLTGSGMSLTMTGHPDLNTISYTEVRQIAENIRSAVPIPLMVDIDTGFGGPLNIYRLLKDFERLDIAAVQIEDQKAPKKCGHEPGRKVVEPEEMIKRIAMLKDNRANNGIVIVARTDARTYLGLDEAIKRANIYLASGADIAFVESPESYEEVKRIAQEVQGPVLFNNVEGGRSPFLSKQELLDAKVKLTIYPNTQTRVIAKECLETLKTLHATGTTSSLSDHMLSHKDLWELFGAEEWYKLEKKYN